MTAFSKKSDLTEFHKIEQLVKAENSAGHFVELVIVVNKFDAADDTDLGDIFRRITTTTLPHFNSKHVFRFSSHKMLIDNVLRSQLDLHRSNHKQEMQRILKTCNIVVAAPEIQRTARVGQVLRYSDLTVQEELGNVLLSDHENEEDATAEDARGEVDSTRASLSTEKSESPTERSLHLLRTGRTTS